MGLVKPIPSGVWITMRTCVERRPRICHAFESPLVDLVQDPDTLEVFGAIVETRGVRRAIRARRGVIESIQAHQVQGEGGIVGAVGGAAIGGVLGHQVGEGSGKKAATVAGAILGGLAGNQVEKRVRSETQYQIAVRMDDGTRQVFTEKMQPAWREGERVRVQNGAIVHY